MPKSDYQRHQEALAQKLGMTVMPGARSSLEEMKKASAINDEALLSDLIDLGIGPDTLMLMSMAPLVAVAWADGEVQDEERLAILQAAASKGIVKGTPPYALLKRWLAEPPGEALLETWEGFVKAIIAGWNEDKAARFKQQLGDLARTVAKASGGILGIGAVSKEEAAIILRIENAFDLGWR